MTVLACAHLLSSARSGSFLPHTVIRYRPDVPAVYEGISVGTERITYYVSPYGLTYRLLLLRITLLRVFAAIKWAPAWHAAINVISVLRYYSVALSVTSRSDLNSWHALTYMPFYAITHQHTQALLYVIACEGMAISVRRARL